MKKSRCVIQLQAVLAMGLLGMPLMATAQCARNEEVLLHCAVGSKSLTLCMNERADVIYELANVSEIELRLVRSLGRYEFRPWPGIGRTIWESVRFENNGFSYEVFGAFDKIDQTPSAGVTVSRGDAHLAELTCDTGGGAFFFDPLAERLSTLGYCAIDEGVVSKGGCE